MDLYPLLLYTAETMLIDNISLKVSGGHGGVGAATFSGVKMTLGPTGGSGGRGGNVYLEAVVDIGALRKYRSEKSFRAEDGRDGRSALRDGHDGQDLILPVPRGTWVKNLTSGEEFELTKSGERILVAKGGKGGKGNYQYKSSTNTSPKQFQSGLPGEEFDLHLELKLIADIGLIGLPNVGKSSFLNELTNSQSRVANYPFTTLEPHLGVYHDLILADIPGIIEGASSGKGLGVKFLRHIERTKILFHFIDCGTDDALRDYKIIRKELGTYSKKLLKKSEYIILSKSDTVDEKRIAEIKKSLKSVKNEILTVSIHNFDQVKAVQVFLSKIKAD